MKNEITIKGAREHNLKNVSLSIPRNKLVVFTGPSGSGKSSLAYDTIFAEGQRRYIESLSAYARQFLGRLDKPDVDEIEGLSPAISIDQKSHSGNPRSTVATITEIYDYLRVLFARVGQPFCPKCGHKIKKMTNEQIVDYVIDIAKKSKKEKEIIILAPVVRGRKGEYFQLLYNFLNAGYKEVRIDNHFHSLHERVELSKFKNHSIDLVVDKIPISFDFKDKDNRLRLSEAISSALKYGNDVVTIIVGPTTTNSPKVSGVGVSKEISLSAKFTCPVDGFSFPEIEPRIFSFNSPYGACPECHGLGVKDFFSDDPCLVCHGKRLKEESLNVLIEGKNISNVVELSIKNARKFFVDLEENLFKTSEKGENTLFEVAELPIKEILNRLKFMNDVGLDYLTLNRKSGTLSGGESQRIRLASQIGSRLVGTLYILDEPTIGLHQRDNERLIKTLKDLRDLGNTILVIEHDEDTIRVADYLVDIGPAAGIHGGKIVAQGPVPQILKDKRQNSLTLDYLRGKEKIEIPEKRRPFDKSRSKLTVKNATANNLKNITVEIPLGRFTAITGVSGSGKSSLVYDVIYKTISRKFYGAYRQMPPEYNIFGTEYLARVINIDQSPIGRTSRSNPATYVGAWTFIRELFAATPEARIRGYKPGRFSFNVKGGRCENCEGHGEIAIEMHFLPTIYVECEVCRGKRFDRETLEVKYQGKNIYEVLKTTVEEAEKMFHEIPWLHDQLKILCDVGLGYLELGQSATTLSGGEAQRIKLASELGKRDTRKNLYLLDEPTTGLHFSDIKQLLKVLNRLVDRGNTIVVIEHNLDVIKTADWVIDLGPEGGEGGGKVIAVGTPEDVAKIKTSATGEYLKKILK